MHFTLGLSTNPENINGIPLCGWGISVTRSHARSPSSPAARPNCLLQTADLGLLLAVSSLRSPACGLMPLLRCYSATSFTSPFVLALLATFVAGGTTPYHSSLRPEIRAVPSLRPEIRGVALTPVQVTGEKCTRVREQGWLKMYLQKSISQPQARSTHHTVGLDGGVSRP